MIDSGPFLLIVGPLAGAAVVWLLGRWPRAAVIAGAVAAAGLGLLLALAGNDVWAVYGRSLALGDGVRAVFQLLLLLVGVLFLLSLRWPIGRDTAPASLAAVSPLAAMVMIRPLALGAFFLIPVAALLAAAVQSGRPGKIGPAWRYLVMMTLALPLLLLTGWLASTPAAFPLGAARVLALAAMIVVGGFPFYMWVRPAARQASPLLLPFLFGGAQLALLLLVFGWLMARPDWQADPGFQSWLRWSGALTVLLGGLLAATAVDGDDLLASLLLLDMGMGLLTLLLPGKMGWETAVAIHLGRVVALLLVGVGRLMWAELSKFGAVLWLYGSLTLLGLPLTAGFGGRWALLNALPGLGGETPAIVLPGLLLLGTACGLWGIGRRAHGLTHLTTERAEGEA